MLREQRLVRGDHRLAGGERGGQRGLDGIAAGDLDDHVDIGIARRARAALRRARDVRGERRRAPCATSRTAIRVTRNRTP